MELSSMEFHKILKLTHRGYFPVEMKEKIFNRRKLLKKEIILLKNAEAAFEASESQLMPSNQRKE